MFVWSIKWKSSYNFFNDSEIFFEFGPIWLKCVFLEIAVVGVRNKQTWESQNIVSWHFW